MRRVLFFALCLALPMGLIAGDAAWAKPRKGGQVTTNANGLGLPNNLTSNKDWLDDGAGNPATGNLQPNAHDNDNYFLEQRNGYDPTWYTEEGSIYDNGTAFGW
jgi:hypothetical protein